MTALLALVTILTWGCWVPLAQAVRGVGQRARVLYVTMGNIVVAGLALIIGGGSVSFGWKGFWLPVVGGLVWVGGNYTAFRGSACIGLARANGTWAPLNIIVSFIWGTLLFGELSHSAAWRIAVLPAAFVLVAGGVFLIVGSLDKQAPATAPVVAAAPVAGALPPPGPSLAPPGARPGGGLGENTKGLLWAAAAGVLWGSYFIPSQWAGVAAQVSNFPLAVGLVAGGLLLASNGREPLRLPGRPAAGLLLAGVLFGTGNITLLALVARVGTGVGFTLAQLALLVSASVGIYLFKVPLPGSAAAHRAMVGIVLAGAGGVAIGALR